MPCGCNDAVGAEHGVISHINVGVIHYGEVEVGIHVFAEMAVFSAPIGMKRRFNVTIVPDFSKHFFEHFGALFLFRRTCHVEIIQTVKALQLLGHNGIVIG